MGNLGPELWSVSASVLNIKTSPSLSLADPLPSFWLREIWRNFLCM